MKGVRRPRRVRTTRSGTGGRKHRLDFSRVTKEDRVKFAILAAIIVVSLVIGIALIPFFNGLLKADTRQQVVDSVRSKGVLGFLIILGVEVLQIVLAVIPGEPVQVIAGMLYGTVGGGLTILLGTVIAGAIVYKLVERLGMPLVRAVVSDEMMKKLDFLNDNKRIDVIVLILFFIPGIPKDVLTYFVPLAEMPMSRFLLVSTVARIPALFLSTYAGSAFTSGNYLAMVIVFVICGGLAIVGIMKRDTIFDWFRERKNKVRALIGDGRRTRPALTGRTETGAPRQRDHDDKGKADEHD